MAEIPLNVKTNAATAAKDVDKLSGSLDKSGKSTANLTKTLGSLDGAVTGVIGSMKGLGAAVGIDLGFKNLVDVTVAYNKSLYNLARASQMTGVDLKAMQSTIQGLTKATHGMMSEVTATDWVNKMQAQVTGFKLSEKAVNSLTKTIYGFVTSNEEAQDALSKLMDLKSKDVHVLELLDSGYLDNTDHLATYVQEMRDMHGAAKASTDVLKMAAESHKRGGAATNKAMEENKRYAEGMTKLQEAGKQFIADYGQPLAKNILKIADGITKLIDKTHALSKTSLGGWLKTAAEVAGMGALAFGGAKVVGGGIRGVGSLLGMGKDKGQGKGCILQSALGLLGGGAAGGGDEQKVNVVKIGGKAVSGTGRGMEGMLSINEAKIGGQAVKPGGGGGGGGIGAGDVVGAAEGIFGKMGKFGKVLGFLGKALPVAGAIYEGYQTIQNVKKGDWGQAGLSLAGTALGMIPGGGLIKTAAMGGLMLAQNYMGSSSATGGKEGENAAPAEAEKQADAAKATEESIKKQLESASGLEMKMEMVNSEFTMMRENSNALIESDQKRIELNKKFMGGFDAIVEDNKKIVEELKKQEAKLQSMLAIEGLSEANRAKYAKELVDTTLRRTTMEAQIVDDLQGNIQAQESTVSLLESQYGLTKSIYSGLGAQVGMINELVDALEVQKSMQQKALDVAKAQWEADKSRNDLFIKYNDARKAVVATAQKELDLTKSLREGYLDAMQSFTNVSGSFGKIITTQQQGMGIMVRDMKAASSVRLGGEGGFNVPGARFKSGTGEFQLGASTADWEKMRRGRGYDIATTPIRATQAAAMGGMTADQQQAILSKQYGVGARMGAGGTGGAAGSQVEQLIDVNKKSAGATAAAVRSSMLATQGAGSDLPEQIAEGIKLAGVMSTASPVNKAQAEENRAIQELKKSTDKQAQTQEQLKDSAAKDARSTGDGLSRLEGAQARGNDLSTAQVKEIHDLGVIQKKIDKERMGGKDISQVNIGKHLAQQTDVHKKTEKHAKDVLEHAKKNAEHAKTTADHAKKKAAIDDRQLLSKNSALGKKEGGVFQISKEGDIEWRKRARGTYKDGELQKNLLDPAFKTLDDAATDRTRIISRRQGKPALLTPGEAVIHAADGYPEGIGESLGATIDREKRERDARDAAGEAAYRQARQDQLTQAASRDLAGPAPRPGYHIGDLGMSYQWNKYNSERQQEVADAQAARDKSDPQGLFSLIAQQDAEEKQAREQQRQEGAKASTQAELSRIDRESTAYAQQQHKARTHGGIGPATGGSLLENILAMSPGVQLMNMSPAMQAYKNRESIKGVVSTLAHKANEEAWRLAVEGANTEIRGIRGIGEATLPENLEKDAGFWAKVLFSGSEQKRRQIAPGVWTGATGGIVPGSGNSDSVPAMLMPGEYVIPKDIAQRMFKGYAEGGFVSPSLALGSGGGGGGYGSPNISLNVQGDSVDKILRDVSNVLSKTLNGMMVPSGTTGRQFNDNMSPY